MVQLLFMRIIEQISHKKRASTHDKTALEGESVN